MPHISCIAWDSKISLGRAAYPYIKNLRHPGVYTLELLQQLPLSILDGSVYHIIQASALVVL